MNKPDFYTDVLIVGGGPAGSAAGISLAQKGERKVMLIDKSDFPRDKACGDAVSPGAAKSIKELGVKDLFENANECCSYALLGPKNQAMFGSITAKHKAGSTSQGENVFPVSDCGYIIPRYLLDSALLAEASEAGVEILTPYTFKCLRQNDRQVVATVTDTNGKETSISARVLIGADGANSRVRAALKQKPAPKNRTGIALRAYANFVPDSVPDMNRIWLSFEKNLLPGYAWMFPYVDKTQGHERQMANIGVGTLVSDKPASRDWFIQQLSKFAERLSDYDIRFDFMREYKTYLLPFGHKLPRLVHGRVALIGDAGNTINPLSGEGIWYALEAGRMLAESMHRDDGRSVMDDTEALTKWEKRFKHRFAKHFRHCYYGHRAIRREGTANYMVNAMCKNSTVAEDVISLMFREGTTGLGLIARTVAEGRHRNIVDAKC